MELTQQNNETYTQFLKRIVEATRNKELDYETMGECLLGERIYSSDNCRKAFYLLNKIVDKLDNEHIATDAEYEKKIADKLLELKKQQVKVRDERNELNKTIRKLARQESFIDTVHRVFAETDADDIAKFEIKESDKNTNGTSDLLVHLTDLHCGVYAENDFNHFDNEVLKSRIERYLNKIIDIRSRHNAKDCHIVIGEIISGLIHENLRIENNENVINQFIIVSTIIAKFIEELACKFNMVNVYVTAGNHSRVVAEKKDSVNGENFDYLLPHYLKAKLQNFTNVEIFECDEISSIQRFKVRNTLVYASHGDRDNVSSVVQNYTLMYHEQPNIVLLGHRHTNSLTTVYDTKVIQSGTLAGTDTYAVNLRMKNKPEQTVSVITDDGLDCIYDVTF